MTQPDQPADHPTPTLAPELDRDLPMGWVEAKLLDLTELIRGVTYRKGDASDTPFENAIPVLRANNITQAGIQLENLVYVPANLVSEQQKVKQNDIIVATSSGSISVVGKAARATADLNLGFGAFCGLIRPLQGVDSRFIGQYFSQYLTG